jgi:hypothetical protein
MAAAQFRDRDVQSNTPPRSGFQIAQAGCRAPLLFKGAG